MCFVCVLFIHVTHTDVYMYEHIHTTRSREETKRQNLTLAFPRPRYPAFQRDSATTLFAGVGARARL